MQIKTKKVFSYAMEMPYALSVTGQKDAESVIFASEAREGRCIKVNLRDYHAEPVWDGPGGTMAVIPDTEIGFWAIRKFYPIFDSQQADIVYTCKTASGQWHQSVIARLPFVHRIAKVNICGEEYLLASTLCGGKEYTDDWSKPGGVYIGKLHADRRQEVTFTYILAGINKNHGMSWHGDNLIITCQEGVYEIAFSEKREVPYTTNRLYDRETSEAYLYDVNQDGADELVTIEGFHGNKVNVYESKSFDWNKTMSLDVDFGHVLWAGKLWGLPCILTGSRGGDKEIAVYIQKSPGIWEQTIVDTGAGPTQMEFINYDGIVYLASCNHGANEVAVYQLELCK